MSLKVSNAVLSKQIDVKSEVGVHLEVDGGSQMNISGILYLTQHDNSILTKLTLIEETSKTAGADKRALGQVLSGQDFSRS